MQTRSHLKSKSFAPRAGLPRKQCTRPHLWEPRPVANADSQPPQKQQLRPEVGPPTKNSGARRSHCGRRDPRRMAPARCPKKLRPEVGPPTKSSPRRPHLWEPRPAANGASSVPEKASPRGRASHKKQCTLPSFVGAATRGERRQLGARKSFALGLASHKKAVHTAPHWEARPLACRLLRRTHDFFAPSRFPAMRACRRSCPYASFQHTRNA